MLLRPGKPFPLSAVLIVDGSEVTTGTTTATITRDNSGTIEYLQSDLTSWGATQQTHALTHSAGVGWHANILIPTSAAGFQAYWTATHDTHGVIIHGGALVETPPDNSKGLEIWLR